MSDSFVHNHLVFQFRIQSEHFNNIIHGTTNSGVLFVTLWLVSGWSLCLSVWPTAVAGWWSESETFRYFTYSFGIEYMVECKPFRIHSRFWIFNLVVLEDVWLALEIEDCELCDYDIVVKDSHDRRCYFTDFQVCPIK